MKLKIGITGQQGFIGQHLYNFLGLFPEEFERIAYSREFFEDSSKLEEFVSKCDVIVHLAAMNRHHDPKIIYETNKKLVSNLVHALDSTQKKPHVIFSSSSQEERDNLYGASKREGRELLANWSKRTGSSFTGMIIPNVFGPFGNPFYNSFIATFSHQFANGDNPTIEVDGEVKLIYIDELMRVFLEIIRSKSNDSLMKVSHTATYKVSDILNKLKSYQDEYFQKGIIPTLNTSFDLNLFNTFRSYLNHSDHFPVQYVKHSDARGAFVEIIRLNVGGQVSFSTTLPGITRGNHYHTRKIERFSVIRGKALIQLRKIGTSKILEFVLDGNEPSYVDMPIWYTHNITNIGEEELLTVFWINEHYDPNDPDTYFVPV